MLRNPMMRNSKSYKKEISILREIVKTTTKKHDEDSKGKIRVCAWRH